MIDQFAVYAPLALLAALLFSTTGGSIQLTSGIYRVCAPSNKIPQGLYPPPPESANFDLLCRVQFFSLETGRILIVGRQEREGTTTKTISRTYMVDTGGWQVSGFDLGWLVLVTLVAYLVVLFSRTGKTIGARVTRMTLVDRSTPSVPGASFGKVVIRYLAMTIGFIPLAAVGFAYAINEIAFESLFVPLVVAGALGMIWAIVIAIQIAAKRDPIYNRLAGTAILSD